LPGFVTQPDRDLHAPENRRACQCPGVGVEFPAQFTMTSTTMMLFSFDLFAAMPRHGVCTYKGVVFTSADRARPGKV
jgi:hypothetical protein